MKLAMWMLQRFGVARRNGPLIGDLKEERAAGRSAFWLWRQTATAIVDTVVLDLRDHWVLALRAVAVGWAASFLFVRITNWVPWFGLWWALGSTWWLFALVYIIPLMFIWPAALGWIVARTGGAHRATMVLAFAASVALFSPWRCVQCLPPNQAQAISAGYVGYLGLSVISILIGGLLPGPRRRAAQMTPKATSKPTREAA